MLGLRLLPHVGTGVEVTWADTRTYLEYVPRAKRASQHGSGQMVSQSKSVAYGLVCVLALGACGPSQTTLEPNVATVTEGPIPSAIEFQEGNVVIGRSVYSACPPPLGGWRMEWLPAGDPVTVDLYFKHQSPEIRFDTLLPSDIQAVEAAGGTIVRTFNTSVIRAQFYRRSLPGMYPTAAKFVPRPDRFDVKVGVGSGDPAVRERFVELGGVITRISANIGAFHGVIPDEAIPEMIPLVRHLVLDNIGGGCLDG